MTQVSKMYFMQTQYLPKICRSSRCLRDVVKGTDHCSAHQPKPKAAPPEWSGKSVIYMIGMEGSDAIKVGYASDLLSRIVGMQVGTPNRLLIHAVFEGGREAEMLMHRELQDSHVRGEWFEASAVMALAEKLFNEGYSRMRLRVGECLAAPNKKGYSSPNYGKVRKKIPG